MELISLQQVAKQLNVSKATLHRYIKQGRIKAMKFGSAYVFHVDDLPTITQVYRDNLSARARNGHQSKKKQRGPTTEERLTRVEQKLDQLLALWNSPSTPQ